MFLTKYKFYLHTHVSVPLMEVYKIVHIVKRKEKLMKGVDTQTKLIELY